uniref:rhodanese-like domain-containing protein 15, chloroplastic n=1 Tax=Ziziphus jujuba TaxID=326968 RepID=A0A6P4AUR1_ZIZJJ
MEATLFSSSACFAGSLPLPPLGHQNLNQRFLFSTTPNQQLCSTGIKHKVSNFCPKAALRGNLEAVGVPTSVPVRVAIELLQAGHRYLDVRTPEEFSAGHAPRAINIPYMYKVGSGMTKNPHFLAEVLSHFRKDDEIIVGCLSGKRSMMAAADLLAAGFSGITDIAGGYAAWTESELPIEM